MTSHRPVVSLEGRAVRRSGQWRPLTSFQHYVTVSHQELLEACREQWDNERCEMISNTTHLVHPEIGQRRGWPKATADCLLSLAAAPTFLIMALLTGVN